MAFLIHHNQDTCQNKAGRKVVHIYGAYYNEVKIKSIFRVFNELEEMWFQSDVNSVGGSNSSHRFFFRKASRARKIEFFSFSSAEDLFRLSENFHSGEFQYQNLPSMNYMSHSYYPKKCDGLCEWTCKLCKVILLL